MTPAMTFSWFFGCIWCGHFTFKETVSGYFDDEVFILVSSDTWRIKLELRYHTQEITCYRSVTICLMLLLSLSEAAMPHRNKKLFYHQRERRCQMTECFNAFLVKEILYYLATHGCISSYLELILVHFCPPPGLRRPGTVRSRCYLSKAVSLARCLQVHVWSR